MKYILLKLPIVIIAFVHGIVCLADQVEDSSQAAEQWSKSFKLPPDAKPWSMEIEDVDGSISGAGAQDLVEGLYFESHGHRQFQHAFAPVAYKLGNPISDFANQGDVVWQVRVHDKLTSELFALAWVHAETKAVFFLYDSGISSTKKMSGYDGTLNELNNETTKSKVSMTTSGVKEVILEATAPEPAIKDPAEVVTVEPAEEPIEKSSNWWLWLIGAVVVVGGVLMVRRKS